jgi:hypothetical protein
MSDHMPSALRPEDIALLDSLRQSGDWLRAILSTLARKGLAFRNAEQERSRALLDALCVYPWYKGGQFLFDLMEWEDFILDGPQPPLVPTALDGVALSRLSSALNQIKSHFDSGVEDQVISVAGTAGLIVTSDDLPELESSMYLYENLVLGVVLSALPSFLA